METSKRLLLQCAAPDAIIRLDQSRIKEQEQEYISNVYHMEQTHESLEQFIQTHLHNSIRSMQVQVIHSPRKADF